MQPEVAEGVRILLNGLTRCLRSQSAEPGRLVRLKDFWGGIAGGWLWPFKAGHAGSPEGQLGGGLEVSLAWPDHPRSILGLASEFDEGLNRHSNISLLLAASRPVSVRVFLQTAVVAIKAAGLAKCDLDGATSVTVIEPKRTKSARSTRIANMPRQ